MNRVTLKSEGLGNEDHAYDVFTGSRISLKYIASELRVIRDVLDGSGKDGHVYDGSSARLALGVMSDSAPDLLSMLEARLGEVVEQLISSHDTLGEVQSLRRQIKALSRRS